MNTRLSPLVCTFLLFASVVSASGRDVPFPAPDTVSPGLRDMIADGLPEGWNTPPRTAEEWKNWLDAMAQTQAASIPALRKKLGVTATPATIAGVPVFIIKPEALPENGLTLLHFHGGGYVLGKGESGTREAVLMAGLGNFKVVSVDYRMAPDFPYPAAIDDAVAVYRELLTELPAQSIGVFGTSTGGAMTLILALRAKAEGLPMPAALAAGTPWSQLNNKGDSYVTNERVDNVLVSYDGWLAGAAERYANGHDKEDPFLSPINGDVRNFPPTLLTSGTRDLFLSNTVRMHLKLREAGVPADLIVFEGLSHAQYAMNEDLPETRFHFKELERFFKKHLRREKPN